MPDAARAAELLRDVDERATVFPHRSAWAPCSLTAATDADPIGNACRLRSLLGTGATGWNLVNLGERNCTLSLPNCVKDVCYATRDVSSLLPQDQIERPLPTSVFSHLELLSGGSNLRWGAAGFSFDADGGTVTLQYSTHTCSAFYAYRGRVERQLCQAPVEAITTLDYGLATDVLC